jgi:hypothetical protein
LYLEQHFIEPARLADTHVLVHEPINKAIQDRSSWVYYTGERRVRRAPFIAYDAPANSSDGLRTFDQYDMYNGAPDRYEWKLLGKQELYVPYNAYRLQAKGIKHKDLLKQHHLNPDFTRYERHRVWKVEAKLKPNARHIYARRIFYFDEDSWQILLADYYDKHDQLWRCSEAHAVNHYQAPLVWVAGEVHYDLSAERYLAMTLSLGNKPYNFDRGLKKSDFTPADLRRAGLR